MAKEMIHCRKCGKEMRLNFEDSRTLCKKCRKKVEPYGMRTTRNFEF